MNLQTVNAILMNALYVHVSRAPLVTSTAHTCGGPRMVPFQSDINRSSPLSRPYEHASVIVIQP